MSRAIPRELAERIRLVTLDVDGVLTDNGAFIGASAEGTRVELKRFDIMDGIGIRMLRESGIAVVLVSGRNSPATSARAEELGLPAFQSPDGHKIAAVREIMADHGLGWADLAHVADDLADIPLLRRVALPVAVANAAAEVRALARWQTRRPGGYGAVREFAEALLTARGEWARAVEAYVRERDEVPS